MAAQPFGLQVRAALDEHGLPVVSWEESRRGFREPVLFPKWRPAFKARCWIGIDEETGELMFSSWHEKLDRQRWAHPPPCQRERPLSDIAGFSLHTARELYMDGNTPLPKSDSGSCNYREDLALVADLKKPVYADIPPIFLLTITSAARVDIMALHATLTEVFLFKIDSFKPAMKARQEKWRKENNDKKRNTLLKSPLTSGGHQFVDLWEPEACSEIENIICAADGEPPFWSFKDSLEESIRIVFYWHVFDRGRNGVTGRWMAASGFYIYSAAHTRYPELIRFVRANLEGFMGCYKPRELFQAVRLFNGSELQLPQAYLATPDARIDASTLILCLEFSDGELLPLTQAPATERENVERLHGQLEYVFCGEGGGDMKIVL